MNTENVTRENVLLLCLSKVIEGRGQTNYIYQDSSHIEPIKVDGYMTNEAPAKVALRLVNLDRIIVICTEEVLNPRPAREGEDAVPPQQTHFEYYQQEISNFAGKIGRAIPDFMTVHISNNPTEQEVAIAAVEAADKMLGDKRDNKEVHVYIDYNGGLRYVAAMLLNIANLMEQRGAVVENIFTMNFENKDQDGRVPVEDSQGILQSSRLVSGIKEYVDYGRCRELNKYFANCEDSEIRNIIDQMDALSHNFNLCDVGRIFALKGDDDANPPEGSIETVKDLLEDYIQEENEDNVYTVLFRYVAKDILEEYRPLFNVNGDLLAMIDWCCEKGFIQQAVTFYAERMPVYFWDKHIYYPSEAEEEEYRQIRSVCVLYKDLNRENPYKRGSKDERDSWMLSNLKAGLGNLCQEMTLDQLRYLIKNYVSYNWKAAWMWKYLEHGNDKNLDWMSAEKRKQAVKYANGGNPFKGDRACTDFKKGDELRKILTDYYNIKMQRNDINHVDDEDADYSNRWPYGTLVRNLKKYVEKIRNYLDSASENTEN